MFRNLLIILICLYACCNQVCSGNDLITVGTVDEQNQFCINLQMQVKITINYTNRFGEKGNITLSPHDYTNNGKCKMNLATVELFWKVGEKSEMSLIVMYGKKGENEFYLHQLGVKGKLDPTIVPYILEPMSVNGEFLNFARDKASKIGEVYSSSKWTYVMDNVVLEISNLKVNAFTYNSVLNMYGPANEDKSTNKSSSVVFAESSQLLPTFRNLSTINIGFLGAGQMAQALCKGILSTGSIKGSQISLADRTNKAFHDYQKYGVNYTKSFESVVQKSKILFLCIKPHGVDKLLETLGSLITPDHLLISVASGVTMKDLKQHIHAKVSVIRMMPNTPCLVQQGAATYVVDENVTEEIKNIFIELSKPNFPVLEEIPEKLIDASVGVSGSGPAYIYLVAEALADGGVKMGLPRDVSNRLAYQTIKGAAEMLIKTGEHPGSLKDKVCSPGGNTIHAIHALEKAGLRASLMNAVEESASLWEKKSQK